MSLSARFAKLKAPAAVVGGGRKQRQDAQKSAGAAKRGNVMANNRGLAVSAGAGGGGKSGKKGKAKGVKVGKGPVAVQGKGKGKGKGGKGKGKGGGKGDATGAADPAALDKAMDTYWFKAGKGPNPEQAALDRQMEAYMKSKPDSAAEAAAPASAAEA